MKKYILFAALFLSAGIHANAGTDGNDSLGLPGDNLDLYGVLDLFKQSASLEDFEKKLNDPTNEINNLDLNEDQNVDYIRVIDQVEGDAHAIILQVPISATESQDVAAIELEKSGTDNADLQVVGDVELYGEDYIVEVKDESTPQGPDQRWQGFRPVVVVNVWTWTCVRFIYAPAYVVWVSPYRWMYYPNYWRPWHPVLWHVHHARVIRYHTHYVCVHHHRMEHAHGCYNHHRVGSPDVHRRYEGSHQRHATNQGQKNRTATSPRGGVDGQHKNQDAQGAGKNKATKGGKSGGAKSGQKSGGQKGGGNRSGGAQKSGGQKRGGGGHR